MKSVLLSATLFMSALGCTRSPVPTSAAPPAPTTEAMISAPSALTLDPAQHAVCPALWTCDDLVYYSTQSECLANCTSSCFRDYNCNGRCICP